MDDLYYQVFFGTQDTVDYVLKQGPWNFVNNLVLACPRFRQHSLRQHGLDVEYFWVLLTGLPWVCYTMEVALKLSKLLDSCQHIQLHEDRILGTKYFRFRILVEVTKPLKRIFGVATPDGCIHMGLLKYERLPTFCFLCGVIGHRFRNCPSAPQGEMVVNGMNYGPWMGGVDHMTSHQLFSIDMEAYGAKEKAQDMVILTENDSSKLTDSGVLSIVSMQGDGRNGDEAKEAVGATTPKKTHKQDNLGSDVMSNPMWLQRKKKYQRRRLHDNPVDNNELS